MRHDARGANGKYASLVASLGGQVAVEYYAVVVCRICRQRVLDDTYYERPEDAEKASYDHAKKHVERWQNDRNNAGP